MSILFDDVFTLISVDAEGKKFDSVSRLEAKSENYHMALTLDVNSEIYQIPQKFSLLLSSVLELDGSNLGERYEYVMHGRVYKFEPTDKKMALYVSFGGLLMEMKGDPRHLSNFKLGSNIYLLIKKL